MSIPLSPRAKFWPTLLLPALLFVGIVSLKTDWHDQPPDSLIGKPHQPIVGKWISDSHLGTIKNHSYEFFPNGTYIERGRSAEQYSMDVGTLWVDIVSSGHYKILNKNVLALTAEKTYINGTSSKDEVAGQVNTKITITGDRAVRDFFTREYWRRIK